ncbi:SCO family protein [Stutzerimonas balearica]|uniref:SCO family protein n=1 Tax=Stutzerimonas balearica TaxID=74829 RepID=UPI0028A2D804|nr:SCO family protein [Stutzerimonas balearica]
MPARLGRLLLIGLLTLATSALALDRAALLDEANIMLFPQPRPLPTVELLTQDAEPWRTDALRGRWHLLFFGFTSCPDICPTTLADMRRLLAELPPEQRANVQLVLVTADPARDSPAQLKDYLSYYRAGFQGLTGDLTQLQSLSRALGLPFVPAGQTSGDYSVSHSGNIALVGPDGRLHGHLRAPLKLDALRRALAQIMASESATQ